MITATYLDRELRLHAFRSGTARVDRSSPQSHGLVAWYPCVSQALGRDTNRQIDLDYGEHETTGTLPAFRTDTHPRWGTCRFVDFNGTDGSGTRLWKESVPAADLWSETGTNAQITVSAWVRYDNPSTNQNYRVIVRHGDGTGTLTTFVLYATGTNYFKTWQNGSKATQTESWSGNADWMHVAFTVNGPDVVWDLFYNGKTSATSSSSVNTATANYSLDIGNDPSWYAQEEHDGLIADVRIYNRALTRPQVWDLYVHPESLVLPSYRAPRVFHVSAGGTFNASVSPGVLTWSAPAVTAEAITNVSVSPGTLTWSAPAVTAEAITNVSVSPGVLTWSAPAVTPTTDGVFNASVSPAVLTWSAPTVTAEAITTAGVSPAVLTWSAPAVTPERIVDATVTPGVLTWSAPAVTVASITNVSVSPGVLTWSAPAVTPDDGSVVITTTGIEYTIPANRLHYRVPANRLHYRVPRI